MLMVRREALHSTEKHSTALRREALHSTGKNITQQHQRNTPKHQNTHPSLIHTLQYLVQVLILPRPLRPAALAAPLTQIHRVLYRSGTAQMARRWMEKLATNRPVVAKALRRQHARRAQLRPVHPVIHAIVLVELGVTLTRRQHLLLHHLVEQTAKVRVVGSLLERQRPAVVEVRHELLRVPLAQPLERNLPLTRADSDHLDLVLHDPRVLLLLRARAQPLPRQLALQKVHEDQSEGLQVVTTTLLDADVVRQARVPRRPRQVLVLAIATSHANQRRVRYVAALRRGVVRLAQPEIDEVNHIRVLVQTHSEIVRFDITVDEPHLVHVLDAQDHLLREHAHRLQREAILAVAEQILQTRTQQVHHHHVRLLLLFKVQSTRNAHAILQHAHYLEFALQLPVR